VSKAATISKLEALLSRIRTRSAEPRHASPPVVRMVVAAAPVARPPVAAAPPVAPPPVAAAPVAPPPVASPPPVLHVAAAPAPVVAPAASPPPAPVAPAAFAPPTPRLVVPPESIAPMADDDAFDALPPPAAVSGDIEFDVDVDETHSAPPEPMAAHEAGQDPFSSSERISVAAPARGEPELIAGSPAELEDEGPSLQSVELLGDHEGIPGDEDEEIEEAPTSSRRPVTSPPEERLADLAFGTEEPQPPRHTPPPKSGRLPAPPTVDFDPDTTGVREASPPPVDDISAQLSVPSPPAKALMPELSLPNLPTSATARVADIIGEAQAFSPATFLALLDSSLQLIP
jgi:hypothetical protein